MMGTRCVLGYSGNGLSLAAATGADCDAAHVLATTLSALHLRKQTARHNSRIHYPQLKQQLADVEVRPLERPVKKIDNPYGQKNGPTVIGRSSDRQAAPVTPAAASTCFNSPFSYISRMMSEPPTHSPLM